MTNVTASVLTTQPRRPAVAAPLIADPRPAATDRRSPSCRVRRARRAVRRRARASRRSCTRPAGRSASSNLPSSAGIVKYGLSSTRIVALIASGCGSTPSRCRPWEHLRCGSGPWVAAAGRTSPRPTARTRCGRSDRRWGSHRRSARDREHVRHECFVSPAGARLRRRQRAAERRRPSGRRRRCGFPGSRRIVGADRARRIRGRRQRAPWICGVSLTWPAMRRLSRLGLPGAAHEQGRERETRWTRKERATWTSLILRRRSGCAAARPSALLRGCAPGRMHRAAHFGGSSARSGSLRAGRMNVLMPWRRAASAFSRMPPTGSTRPLNVISPVIATSSRTV